VAVNKAMSDVGDFHVDGEWRLSNNSFVCKSKACLDWNKKESALDGCRQGDAANQNLIESGTDRCFIVILRRQEYSIHVRWNPNWWKGRLGM